VLPGLTVGRLATHGRGQQAPSQPGTALAQCDRRGGAQTGVGQGIDPAGGKGTQAMSTTSS
jgi:hypothetical protein